jgi:hypothetical protein
MNMSKNRNISKPSKKPPAVWPPVVAGIISLAIAVAAGFLAERYPDVGKHSIIILSIVGALLTFQIAELHHRYSLSKELSTIGEEQSTLTDTQENLLREIDSIRKGNEVARVFEPLRAIGWREQVDALAAIAPIVDHRWAHSRQEASLLEWKRTEIFNAMLDGLRSLADGDLLIESPEKELITNGEFLATLCRRTFRAVSYQDEEFWATDAGKAFLAIHSAAIVRRVDLERIFIIERSREDELKPVFAIQKRIGISARVVFKDQLSRHAESVQDFVIYDDQYVRFAKLKDHPTNAIDKVATLSKNPATIERFSNHYRVLHSHSHPV